MSGFSFTVASTSPLKKDMPGATAAAELELAAAAALDALALGALAELGLAEPELVGAAEPLLPLADEAPSVPPPEQASVVMQSSRERGVALVTVVGNMQKSLLPPNPEGN